MENMINKIKDNLNEYLQNECHDYWNVRKDGYDTIVAYYAGTERFKLEFDEDDWYFSGQDISIETINTISEIAKEALKEWEEERNEI